MRLQKFSSGWFIRTLILCLITGLSGCQPADRPKIDLSACILGTIDAQCGKLSVYENRQTRTGRMIDIHVAVIKARGADPQPDPIFYFAGGPGGSAIDDASYAMKVLNSARQWRDIVLIDQRGTGRSNPLTCPRSGERLASIDPIDPQAIVELQECLSQLDADPSAYTTAWSVDDFDEVREALGYDQINLYGESYGPTAEQVYLQRHGEHVRTMILEGSSLLDVPMFERYPWSIQQAFNAIATRCASDDNCHQEIPNLQDELNTVLARVEQQPVQLPLTDPLSGQSVVLTRALLVSGIFSLIHTTNTAVYIPRLLHQAYLGKWGEITQVLTSSLSAGSPKPVWRVMNLVILCHEDWARMGRQETEKFAAQSFVRYEEARSLVVPEEVCALVPGPDAAALYKAKFRSKIPVLIINNGADPSDPPENVASAADHYPNSLVLVAPGQGHGWNGFECRDQIYADFFDTASTRNLDAACLDHELLPDLAPIP